MTAGPLLAIVERFGPRAAEHPFLRQVREHVRPKIEMLEGGIAVVPIEGVLCRKPSVYELLFDGVEDTDSILGMVNDAASNPQVRGILLDVDSPGGFMTGGPEVGEAVKRATKSKPVVAWSGGQMCSLAYWIGSQAQAVISSRSADIGSIGVFCAFNDYSALLASMGIKVEVFKNKEAKFKAMGVPGTSLDEEQRAFMQEDVQRAFSEFKSTVRSSRPNVTDEAMMGNTMRGKFAKEAGLVDGIGDKAFAITKLRKGIKSGSVER